MIGEDGELLAKQVLFEFHNVIHDAKHLLISSETVSLSLVERNHLDSCQISVASEQLLILGK